MVVIISQGTTVWNQDLPAASIGYSKAFSSKDFLLTKEPLVKYLVISAVFMVSTLTACVLKEVGEESIQDRKILTFAKIAQDIEADPEKARNAYVGRVVTIRAKAAVVTNFRKQFLEDLSRYVTAHLRVGKGFVSFWVSYTKDELFQPEDLSLPDGDDYSRFYFLRVRIKAIDPNMVVNYWTVWTELLEWPEEYEE